MQLFFFLVKLFGERKLEVKLLWAIVIKCIVKSKPIMLICVTLYKKVGLWDYDFPINASKDKI